ncbi:hypothetical protein AAIL08_001680 [Campylobacter upsaliensis]|uniref:hypothetical protein n=1 Tax=Campylobacter upsaliensis TaxID=28080 RepID=UPI000E1AAA3D|nr:hypothetical protein [Campylobacter upsaliensis]EAI3918237.1 hypothetical protein [Campylobacter upsaliensis]EAI4345747.1 hypothetical protein [Campylobacter upsaliensis]EAJ7108592.1 hypothetical protein [Campylobacter upsaliensis]EDP6892519.1 hypothetical protein [Campylobacter upsaliensis]EHD8285408.1 hypothetical protein [Campylobacter upsaliensis]
MDKKIFLTFLEHILISQNDLNRIIREIEILKKLQAQNEKIDLNILNNLFADCLKNQSNFSKFILELLKNYNNEKENICEKNLNENGVPNSYLE